MKPLVVIIFLVIAVSAILYVVSKAPALLTPFSGISSSTFRSAPPAAYRGSAPTNPSYQSAPETKPGYLPNISDYQIPKGFTRADLSPYFGKVRISSAYGYASGNSNQDIRLYAYMDYNESADISGWTIKSNRGQIALTQAINSYDPSGFSLPADIVLRANHTADISGGVSPLSRNFRLNKCSGYLNGLYAFNPPLPQSCPRPDEKDISRFSGQCQSYIQSLGSCALPDPTVYNNFPGTAEGNACRNFLNGITYKGCYDAHSNDADFLSNEWRLWVNQNILDPQHDTVRLYDRQGLLADQYQY